MLANVRIRRWTGRRLDRKVTDEVNQQNQAEDDAGRYNKLLISKTAFEGINAATRSARQAHYTLTLPWADEGPRLLPAEQFQTFAERFGKYRENFDLAADEFAKKYPEYRGTAKKRLGRMFNDEDYPDSKSVRGMFSFNVLMAPVADASDYRVKLGVEQLKDLKTSTEAWMKDALAQAMRDPAERIVDVVGRMVERLKNYKPANDAKGTKASGLFRDSLVTNIEELVELLPAFNLTNDKMLDGLTKRMKSELCKTNATTLREDERVRVKTAKSAEAILAAAQKLLA